MNILSLYVASEGEANSYMSFFRNLGQEPVVRVVAPGIMRLPALRTDSNLYQGAHAVGRVLSDLSGIGQ